jgi:putative tricarboxylic transport membrane protein
MKAAKADFWSGLALAGLGTYIIAEAWRWEYIGNDGPGPGFFPLWYGIAMVALSLVLVVSSFMRAEAVDPASPTFGAVSTASSVDWSGAGRALAAWGAFALAAAALKWLGFFVCFAALTFFVVAVMYRRPLKVAAVVAVLLGAGFYLVFALALGVKLP